MLGGTLACMANLPSKWAWNPGASPTSKVAVLKLFQPACLCLGLFGRLEERGLGEPFGKASSANTISVSSRFVPITNGRSWRVERWLRHSSEAWPYEALERGLPRPFAKRRKNWGRAKKRPLCVTPLPWFSEDQSRCVDCNAYLDSLSFQSSITNA